MGEFDRYEGLGDRGETLQTFEILKTPVDIITAPPGTMMSVRHLLRNPEHFHGDPDKVHQLVNFGQLFAPTIGKHDISEDQLREKGIIVAEKTIRNLQSTADRISGLASHFISTPALYDDISASSQYLNYVREGYRRLTGYQEYFCVGPQNGRPVSLMRAGLIATRAARGKGRHARVPGEVVVNTKRAHLKGFHDTDLAVTVYWPWPTKRQTHSLDGAVLDIADIVNPASGASTIAFVLALKALSVHPAAINIRTLMIAEAGALLTQTILQDHMQIPSSIYALSSSNAMNEAYYLTGVNGEGRPRVVADAGHATRHSLPWFKWLFV